MPTQILPIVITILRHGEKYVFIKRNKSPYEGLWSLVGGKLKHGEHLHSAAVREVCEETDTKDMSGYSYRGLVSERLLNERNELLSHFLIFVGRGVIDGFNRNNREGELKEFSISEILEEKGLFLPSDWCMFNSFELEQNRCCVYEAELVYDGRGYHLNYYRTSHDCS